MSNAEQNTAASADTTDYDKLIDIISKFDFNRHPNTFKFINHSTELARLISRSNFTKGIVLSHSFEYPILFDNEFITVKIEPEGKVSVSIMEEKKESVVNSSNEKPRYKSASRVRNSTVVQPLNPPKKMCNYENECTNPFCWFKHPDGRVNKPPPRAATPSKVRNDNEHQPAPVVQTLQEKEQPLKKMCNYENECTNPFCWFKHPDGRVNKKPDAPRGMSPMRGGSTHPIQEAPRLIQSNNSPRYVFTLVNEGNPVSIFDLNGQKMQCHAMSNNGASNRPRGNTPNRRQNVQAAPHEKFDNRSRKNSNNAALLSRDNEQFKVSQEYAEKVLSAKNFQQCASLLGLNTTEDNKPPLKRGEPWI